MKTGWAAAQRQREAWAMAEFGTADLGDARRTKRLVKTAAAMASDSSGSIPRQTGNSADMKAAYRLFAGEAVTHAAVCRPHFERTRELAGKSPVVFLIQDSAQLNFTSHPHCEGLVPIGQGNLRGMHQQNVLAADPVTRRPLGLMYQHHPDRVERGPDHDRSAKRRVPLEERESHWWIQAIRTIGPPPSGVRWVHVGDRAEDVFGVYDECRQHGTDWLIRASHDRCVDTPVGTTHLFAHVRALPSLGTRRLTVRDQNRNRQREAFLSMAAGPVTLHPPASEKAYAGREPVQCWVVRIWEAEPPAETEPLEWILLTSLECHDATGAQWVAEGYALRWMIEEFHKCEKTGCQVELRRLEHVDRLEPLIGVLSVLAVWLLKLKYAARDTPEQLARAVFDDDTVAVMASYLKLPADSLTTSQFWRGIGRLGGHPGRKGDGPLGWLRAWNGWQRFQLMLLGASLHRQPAG